MSVIGNPLLLGGDAGAPSFTTQRSVRLRLGASAYFNRTLSGSGNLTTWSWSNWVKRGKLGASQKILGTSYTSISEFYLRFNSSDQLEYGSYTNGGASNNFNIITTQVFRDPSAWYHITFIWDTTQATAANRVKMYVNGSQITSFSTATYPTLNYSGIWNNSSWTHYIGSDATANYFDGYLTEMNFIDGQALTPSSFGEYDSVRNTQWKPKAYTGTYGTNGFYLPFTNTATVGGNGLSYSEDFTNAAWGKYQSTVTGNAAVAPNGTTTADKLIESATIGDHQVTRTFTATDNTAYTLSAYAKAGERSAFRLYLQNKAGTYNYADFNLSTGVVGFTSGTTAVITAVGNDWYRCSVSCNVGTGATASPAAILSYATTSAGSGTNGLYIWGAQLEGSTSVVGAYYSTTTTGFGAYQIGADQSLATGGYNSWVANNISLTAGVNYDSMTDVPTLTSETASNYAVMNPLARSTFVANSSNPSTGNLVIYQATTASWAEIIATMGVTSGKWYWEIHCSNLTASSNLMLGVVTEAEHSNLNSSSKYVGSNTAGYGYYSVNGNKYNNGVGTAYGSAYVDNDIVGVALDMDVGTLTFYKNGVSQGVAFSGLTGTMFPAFSSVSGVGNVNFGQRPLAYPLAGHKSLNSYNLPDPAITSSDDYHKVYTYTGNGGGLQVGEIQKPASLFNLDRSLRLRASNSAYLNRTFSSSPTTFTFSCWVKRGTLGVQQVIAASRLNGAQSAYLIFNASDQLQFLLTNGTLVTSSYVSTAVFRDPSAWYHVVFSSTAGGTGYVYVNNVQVVSGSVPAGYWLFTNTASWVNAIGRLGDSATSYLDGYLADVYFIDGQALTPTDFGTYDGNYYWTPKAYSGTYGTNGFHLEFEDFSAATAAAIGKDTSGNGNNWTPTGIDLTTPQVDNEYWDSYTDVPTLNDADTCNYCTLDPLQPSSTGLRNGNLTAVWTAANTAYKQRGTYTLNTGKWYFEGNLEAFTIGNAGNTNYAIGFITTSGVDTHVSFGWTTTGASMKLGYRYDVAGVVVQNVSYNTVTPVSTDIFGIEYDVDNGTANFYKNGTLMGSASGLALGTVNPHIWRTGTSNSATMHVNFGQRSFKYTPSTGYKKINAFNVAEVTGDLESPDFVWIKSRSATTNHALFNSVTGVGKYLSSNATTAETTDVNSLIQFNKNGFLLGNAAIVNTSAATYVASAWKVAATTVSNTDGTIASQVRANPTAGISVVTYTGTGANATVGHGLGVAPNMVIVKVTNTTASWCVWHSTFVTAGNSDYLLLNTNDRKGYAGGTSSPQNVWNSIVPSPTVFSIGTYGYTNSASTYIAYCFAEIAGFSKFGSYIGNGANDGAFVYTGFIPRWVMIKRTDVADNWAIFDTSRLGYNADNNELQANATTIEGTTDFIDILSNGFKNRNLDSRCNASGGTYIYAAFAEHPFKYALAR